MLTHFILIGNEFPDDYRRAIKTAEVHGGPIRLWFTGDLPDTTGLNVKCSPIDIPAWLKKEEPAHIYDVLAYQVGLEHGGIVLGLDTISIADASDLLGERNVVVSSDWPQEDWAAFPDCYNNNFICRAQSQGMLCLYAAAQAKVTHESKKDWGYTGPKLLTPLVRSGIIAAAPYPTLCGWSPGYIWRFYLGIERPHPNTRVIHLCKTAYHLLHERKYDDWAKQYPLYAGPVERRTNLNDDLLFSPT